MEINEKNIKEAVGQTWFDLEEFDDHFLLATRENGDVGDETPGDDDLHEAGRLRVMLRQKFGQDAMIDIEPVDEWVHVTINKEYER